MKLWRQLQGDYDATTVFDCAAAQARGKRHEVPVSHVSYAGQGGHVCSKPGEPLTNQGG